ncbi:SDR family oxidoreductase [Hyunsoonleella pacifica]|uniref:SDR family oxidoreductase n=1 Tax=Hyunsoonleella pacifica TaxID=1080224 RepID=A0A4Q9FTS7_9FLAO|nr:SDR family oxidoreductase [Hyunsoonleella pacifica]TBN17559.1 SDR family oxidoreductase [Hyunsoonleella pacifica]GGD10907.1 short-chain dehydrogenase/reductase [Hyunsoonleella pacifica]
MENSKNKTVVITGSSSGFGYLTTLTLARKGYKIWATMRNTETKNATKKEELLTIAKTEKLNISVIDMDVNNDDSVANAITTIANTDGKIDHLINNAGYMFVGITEAYSIQQAKDQFETNFFGILRTTKAVLPYMRQQQDGHIVNVTSLAGRLSFPYFGIYCASKHAVEAYSQALRYELAPFGVEVNIVEPGPFGTNLLFTGPKEEDQNVFNAYGEHKNVPHAMLKNFEGFYATDDAPNPQLVADSITELVETKKGNRPERVVSGIDYGVVDYNTKVLPIQESLVKDALQMGHLLTIE